MRRDNVIDEKDKDDIFDGYMDEETIEMISEEFPVLTEDEKDRIFASIERKLDIKSEKTFLTSDSVEGVEKYNRSQIVRFAGLAAAFTIIVAGLGGGNLLLHNLNKNAPPGPEPEMATQAVTGTSRSTTTIAFTYTTATAKTSILSVQTTTASAASSSATRRLPATSSRRSSKKRRPSRSNPKFPCGRVIFPSRIFLGGTLHESE